MDEALSQEIRRTIHQVKDDDLRQSLSELLTEATALVQQNRDLQQLVSDMKIFVEEQCVWPKTPESNDTADELLARARQLLPEELQI